MQGGANPDCCPGHARQTQQARAAQGLHKLVHLVVRHFCEVVIIYVAIKMRNQGVFVLVSVHNCAAGATTRHGVIDPDLLSIVRV